MAIFDYKAKDKNGNTVIGAVEAPTENIAYDVLKEQNLVVIALTERRRITLLQSSLGFFKRVPRKEVVMFARQLAVMISATVPIVQALRILVKQTSNISFKIIISEVADEIDGGARLSTTLARYPQVFSNFFVHMIRSGETTGKLDETLNYLADQQEKDYDLLQKIRGAMIYPVFVMGGMLVVGALMMIFVLPKLTEVLKSGGAKLPLSTRIVIGASTFLQHSWWAIILIIIVAVVIYRLFSGTPYGHKLIDSWKMKVPVFGNIFQTIYLVRFARSLSTLVVSGVQVTRSLEIVADVIDNDVYKELILDTIKEVEGGNTIASVFSRSKVVPVMLPQMLSVGEQTGKLDLILDKMANFYTKELENMIANLVSLIEPFILVIMGVAVAVMVMSILLPMYNLSQAI